MLMPIHLVEVNQSLFYLFVSVQIRFISSDIGNEIAHGFFELSVDGMESKVGRMLWIELILTIPRTGIHDESCQALTSVQSWNINLKTLISH